MNGFTIIIIYTRIYEHQGDIEEGKITFKIHLRTPNCSLIFTPLILRTTIVCLHHIYEEAENENRTDFEYWKQRSVGERR